MSSPAAKLPILTFHALDGMPSSVVSLSPVFFGRALDRMRAGGYRTISLLDAVRCLRQKKPFLDRTFAVTFDDGYQTVYRHAFPLLQKYSLSATVFLTVGNRGQSKSGGRLRSLEGREMLSWEEIREMHRWGITFAAHTVTHPDLTRLTADQVRSEACDSKAVIEDALGIAVTSFAYPYGRHNQQVREIVAQHFACACSDRLGLVTLASDPYALERVDAYCLRKEWGFDIVQTRLFPWYLRTYRILRRARIALNARRKAGTVSHARGENPGS
jgi:peptidoglycan/xylan/chitin deacetylase (PgdA/CDA1 family)